MSKADDSGSGKSGTPPLPGLPGGKPLTRRQPLTMGTNSFKSVSGRNIGHALVVVSGDGNDTDIGELNGGENVPTLLDVQGESKVRVGKAKHQPHGSEEESTDKRHKYFGGFSFSKGDHLDKK